MRNIYQTLMGTTTGDHVCLTCYKSYLVTREMIMFYVRLHTSQKQKEAILLPSENHF